MLGAHLGRRVVVVLRVAHGREEHGIRLLANPERLFGERIAYLVDGIRPAKGIRICYLMAEFLAYGIHYIHTLDRYLRSDPVAGQNCYFEIHVVYVLSEEKKEGYQHGFITKEILEPYMKEDVTVMMCGPEAMYEFVTKELESFHLPIRRVKKEANCVASRKGEEKTYQLTVHIGFDTFQVPASSNETILVALERASLPVPSKCRAGGCGFCHSKLVSGKYTIAGVDKRRLADLKFGYIHPCCTYPDSDMELIVPKREEIH